MAMSRNQIALGNIDLINELLELDTTIRKVNDSLSSWQRTHDRVSESFMDNKIDERTYRAYLVDAVGEGNLLGKYLAAFQSDLIECLAAIRALVDDDTTLGKITRWTTSDRFGHDFEIRRKAQRELILAEARGELPVVRNRVSAVQALRMENKKKV